MPGAPALGQAGQQPILNVSFINVSLFWPCTVIFRDSLLLTIYPFTFLLVVIPSHQNPASTLPDAISSIRLFTFGTPKLHYISSPRLLYFVRGAHLLHPIHNHSQETEI